MCFGIAWLSACATKPAPAPPPPPTIAELSIKTAKDAYSADEEKVLVVRVFRLADPAAFQSAGYQDLFEKDQATLGTDLVGTIDILIMQGTEETFDRRLTDRERYLGFVVSYPNTDKAQWRALVPLKPHSRTKVEVDVKADGVVANTVDS